MMPDGKPLDCGGECLDKPCTTCPFRRNEDGTVLPEHVTDEGIELRPTPVEERIDREEAKRFALAVDATFEPGRREGYAPDVVANLARSYLACEEALREACLHQGLPEDAPPERIAAHFRNGRELKEAFAATEPVQSKEEERRREALDDLAVEVARRDGLDWDRQRGLIYQRAYALLAQPEEEDHEQPCEHGIAWGEFCPRCPGGGV